MAVLLGACGKDPLPEKQIRFSVLGDSYSAFEGYVQPDSNDVWYCPPPDNFINVTSVEEMWWHQVGIETGWKLDMNNSFSGSLICNKDVAHYYGACSFLRRMDNLGHPDVIFVFGGTNDVWQEAPLGNYVYNDWTEMQLCSFRPALAYLFASLQNLYPEATVYFMLDMQLGSGPADAPDPEEYKRSIQKIATHYGVPCIELNDVHKDWAHPDKQGQESIARQVLSVVMNS